MARPQQEKRVLTYRDPDYAKHDPFSNYRSGVITGASSSDEIRTSDGQLHIYAQGQWHNVHPPGGGSLPHGAYGIRWTLTPSDVQRAGLDKIAMRESRRTVMAPRRPQARPPARPEPKREADAGFAIGIHDQGVIEQNARERADEDHGDPEWRDEMVHLRLMTKDGDITPRGWDLLNRDIERLERNSLAWMRATFNHVRDEGHGSTDELIGTFWFDPTDSNQAWLVELATPEGRSERIDMNDSSFGDLANMAFNEVSDFGGSLLGGQIVFFDVKPEDMEIIETTTAQPPRKRRGSRRRN